MYQKPYFEIDKYGQVHDCSRVPNAFKKKFFNADGQSVGSLLANSIQTLQPHVKNGRQILMHDWEIGLVVTKHNQYLRITLDLTKNNQHITPVNRYKLLVEAANDVIFEINNEGVFTYLNPKALELSGFKKEEIIGEHFTKLTRPDWHAKTINFYKEQLDKAIPSTYFEFPVANANNEEIWLGQKAQLLEDESGVLGLMAIGRDITKEKRANETLQKSEEKYRDIIQNLNVGLLEVDNEHNIKYVNSAFAKMVGYSTEELREMNASSSLISESSKSIIDEEQAKRIAGDSSYYEVPLLHRNGNVVWTLISGAPLLDDDGKTRGTIGVHLDISDRKANEAELKFTQTRLDKYKQGLELINEITTNVSLTTFEQLNLGLETAAAYLELPLGIISEINADDYRVKDYYMSDESAGLYKGQIFKFQDTYCEIVYKKESFVAIDHFSKSEFSKHPCFETFGLESYIGAPYYVNGELRGTINFSSPDPKVKPFDSFDTEFVSLLSKWIGALISQIENREALAQERSSLKEKNEELLGQKKFLTTINTFVSKLLDKDELEDISWEIVENVIHALGFEDCVIYLMNKERTGLSQLAAYGAKKGESRRIINPLEVPLGEGIVGTVAKSGKAEIIEDTTKDSRYIVDDEARLSELSVPIISDGEVIGVIDSESSKKGFFTQKDLDTLSTIANLTANRLKIAQVKEMQSVAEAELLDNERKLRTIINSALDAVISIDSRGIVTEWNIQAEKMFGFTAKEVIGTSLTESIIPPEHRNAHATGMKHYNKTGEGPVLGQKIEITAIRKSGEVFPIELAIVPIVMKGIHTFTAFISDISIQKEVQRETEKALNKERELNELKSRFVAMTSHEFRTPLTTIKQNIDLISYKISTDLPDSEGVYNKFIGRIESEINRVTLLMNDILTLGRIESGGIEIKKKQADLVNIFKETIRIRTQSRSDGRSIKFKVTGVPRPVLLDEQLFDHILTNLISNAFKYSEGKADPEIYLDFSELDNVNFSVKDDGIGIPAKDQKGLFSSFYRATNVQNIQGSGLGLSIVKEFIEMHGGSIEVDSKKNTGSTFKLKMPFK